VTSREAGSDRRETADRVIKCQRDIQNTQRQPIVLFCNESRDMLPGIR